MSVTIFIDPTDEDDKESLNQLERRLESNSFLNVSNRNFTTLWNSLGFEMQFAGQMDAKTLKRAVDALDPHLLVRSTAQTDNFIDCGINRDQIAYYINTLEAIVKIAEHMDIPICWG